MAQGSLSITLRLELLAAVAAFIYKQKDGRVAAEIATLADCSMRSAYVYLEMLHAKGLIYLKGIRRGRAGPPTPLWSWQDIGVFHMDDDVAGKEMHDKQQQREYRKVKRGDDQPATV